jgi:hypothetical protein
MALLKPSCRAGRMPGCAASPAFGSICQAGLARTPERGASLAFESLSLCLQCNLSTFPMLALTCSVVLVVLLKFCLMLVAGLAVFARRSVQPARRFGFVARLAVFARRSVEPARRFGFVATLAVFARRSMEPAWLFNPLELTVNSLLIPKNVGL